MSFAWRKEAAEAQKALAEFTNLPAGLVRLVVAFAVPCHVTGQLVSMFGSSMLSRCLAVHVDEKQDVVFVISDIPDTGGRLCSFRLSDGKFLLHFETYPYLLAVCLIQQQKRLAV